MRAEINELDAGSADELARDQRHQDLAAVADRHQAGRPIQRRAVIVAVAQLGHPGVHGHANPERAGLRPRLTGQRELRVDRGVDPVGRGREHGEEAVTGGLDHVPAVTLDGLDHQLVVSRQRRGHRVRMLFPQARRTLQIGEQERDRPRRQLRHRTPFTDPAGPASKPGKPDRRRPAMTR